MNGHGGTVTARARLGAPRRAVRAALAITLAATYLVAGPPTSVAPVEDARAAGTFADPHFREYTIWSGLDKPTAVRFASDGRAFVSQKGGVIKAYDSVTDTTPTTVIDLSAEVMNYWDRGLLNIVLDPAFPTNPYLYAFYVWGGPIGAGSQTWGDTCPGSPGGPGATTDGCVASSKLERLTLDPSTNQVTSRKLLMWDVCQQFPSHAGGAMAFGSDGQLYLALGDGANFNGLDYGQRGGTIPNATSPITPVNPCQDPVNVTSPAGQLPIVVEVPTAEGGALRSQDVRTTGDPTQLGGALIRIDPSTGAASSGNPLASSSDANTKKIVAAGFRNPYRLTFRPGTSEMYIGHVGNSTWEAIDKVSIPASATPTTIPNAGWPCYEGPGKAPGYSTLGTNLCEAFYAQGAAAWQAPFYSYSHKASLSPTGPCFSPDSSGEDGAAVTGVAFYKGASGSAIPYPSKYLNGLFFVDYDRDCLAFFPAGAGGVPSAAGMELVASGIGNPVDLATAPNGDLLYADLDGGRIVGIRYLAAPIARATATPSHALAPVTVHLDASTSSDPDPSSTLTGFAWDLDDDGEYDDATGVTFDWLVTNAAVYDVGLKVTSSNGLSDTATVRVDTTNAPPVPVIDAPSGSLTWAVGDTISYSGHGTDAEDGTLSGSKLSWDLVLLHCPSDCHEHFVEEATGTSGSFTAPDHEYPAKLEIRLTATDSQGSKATTSVELLPKTRTVSVTSSPSGVPIEVAGTTVSAPGSVTVIQGSEVSLTAPLTRDIGGTHYRFSRWADSTERVRTVVASSNLSLAATYAPDVSDSCASARTSSTGSWVSDRPTGAGDVDWYRFTLKSRHRMVITLGDVPVNARFDLYSSCSTRLATVDATSAARYEELTRILSAGTYRVKVSFPGGGRSDNPYVLRFRAMSSGLPVKSWRATSGSGGGSVRIVGEVLNNAGRTVGRPIVKATFRNASGTVVRTLSTKAFAARLGDGSVTPFVLTGSVPTYASVSFSVSAGSLPAKRSLSLTSLTRTSNSNGTVTEKGSVKNVGSTTARSVAVARTWYGKRGEVLDRGSTFTSPSTLAPGKSGAFTIIRPALTSVQGTRTGLRAS
jgi:glucose/arabinose dehydrogenase